MPGASFLPLPWVWILSDPHKEPTGAGECRWYLAQLPYSQLVCCPQGCTSPIRPFKGTIWEGRGQDRKKCSLVAQTVNGFESPGDPTFASTLSQVSFHTILTDNCAGRVFLLQRKTGHLPWDLMASLHCLFFLEFYRGHGKEQQIQDNSGLLPLVTWHEIFIITITIVVAVQ